MNRDRVKRWSDSVRYYKLVRLQKEKYYIEAYNIGICGHSFYPKKKPSEDVVSVTKVTIFSPILLSRLMQKRDKKKKDLEQTYHKKISKEEEILSSHEETREQILERIAKLKKGLIELKEKEDEEYDKEVRRGR